MSNDASVFSFICCVNDEDMYRVCEKHIDALYVPEGFTVEKIVMKEAKSMVSGYNEAMRKAKGKYKIYHHQDAWMIEKRLLYHMISLFEASEVGMIGVCGTNNLPPHGVWWDAHQRDLYGVVIEERNTIGVLSFQNPSQRYERVEAIDGLVMATQYDLPWDEQFDGWHFYDVSQSSLFQKAGLEVIVPHQDSPWVYHKCGVEFDQRAYEQYRRQFIMWKLAVRN